MATDVVKIKNSILWKLLERFSTQAVSFIISIILARILTPSDFGIIAIVLIFINIANIIIDGGLNTSLIQKKNANQEDFSTIFWFCLFLAGVLYISLFFFSPFISDFYNSRILTPVLRVIGLSVFFNSIISIQYAYVAKKMMFRKLFYVNATSLFVSGFVGLHMAYNGFGVWALVAQYLLNTVFCSILLLFRTSWKPSFVFSYNSFLRLFNYGWKIFVTNFIISIFENSRSFVIGKLYQPSSLAFFDRGKLLPSIMVSNIIAALEAVLLPTFSEEQDNRLRVKQMLQRSIKIGYIVISPLLVILFVTAKFAVILLLTEKWLPAVPFVQIFCVAFLLMPIQNINIACIKSLGFSNITLKQEIIKKVVELFILIGSFMINVYAVAWGVVLYNFISLFINVNPTKKILDYNLKEQISDISPILFSSVIMGTIIYICSYIPFNGFVIFIIQIIVGFSSFYYLCRKFANDSVHYILDYILSLRSPK